MSTVAIIASSFVHNDALCSYARERLVDHDLLFAPRFDAGHDPKRKAELLSDEALTTLLRKADAAIIGKERITSRILKEASSLRVISKYGVGLDNIDEVSCVDRKIEILVTPGVNADAAAELTIGLVLAVMRNICLCDRLFHRGIWKKDGGFQLAGKKVGIIGCGRIGSRVARILRSFSCELLLCDVVSKDEFAKEIGAKIVSFNEAISLADIITVHVPLNRETTEMFSKSVFSKMKPGSIFVNTSRGRVVREADLKESLRYGPLWGAALDVFQAEPVEDEELFHLENLVATPHIGGNSREAVRAMGEAAVDQLVQHFQNLS